MARERGLTRSSLSTSVVVNHGGNWLLMHSHHTILSN
jgi:hypothetical protein